MASDTFVYSLSVDFPSGIANGQLYTEIDGNVGITQAVEAINVEGDVVTITFDADISIGEQTILNSIIAAHVPAAEFDADVVQPIYGTLFENNPTGTTLVLTGTNAWTKWITGSVNIISDSNTVASGTSELTIDTNGAGKYHIVFSASFSVSNVADTVDYQASVFKNGITEPSIVSQNYIDNTNQDHVITGNGILDLIVNDTLDLRFKSTGTNQSIDIKTASLSLVKIGGQRGESASIFAESGVPSATLGNTGDFYIDTDTGLYYTKQTNGWIQEGSLQGPQGIQGVQGPAGADSTVPGPVGSGVNINLQEEGVLVTNTPHDILNFVGGDITVTDAGSGVANITLNPSDTTTASNIGTAGVGVFKQKTGSDFEFKKINNGSNKVTVTDNVANNRIDIDLTESNIDHQNLNGAGTNTHTQIDSFITTANSHITDVVSNPHAITLDSLSPATTKGDILAHDGANLVRFPVGSQNMQFLTVDNTKTTGLDWVTISAGLSISVTLTGTTPSQISTDQRGSCVISAYGNNDGMPAATFHIAKSTIAGHPQINRLSASPGETTGEFLDITWVPTDTIRLFKTGNGHDGIYTIRLI